MRQVTVRVDGQGVMRPLAQQAVPGRRPGGPFDLAWSAARDSRSGRPGRAARRCRDGAPAGRGPGRDPSPRPPSARARAPVGAHERVLGRRRRRRGEPAVGRLDSGEQLLAAPCSSGQARSRRSGRPSSAWSHRWRHSQTPPRAHCARRVAVTGPDGQRPAPRRCCGARPAAAAMQVPGDGSRAPPGDQTHVVQQRLVALAEPAWPPPPQYAISRLTFVYPLDGGARLGVPDTLQVRRRQAGRDATSR